MGCCHSGNASASAGTPVDDAGDQEHRKVLLLSDSPLLIHLTEPQLKELAGLFTVHRFAADTVIFTAGDPADCLCFVGEGTGIWNRRVFHGKVLWLHWLPAAFRVWFSQAKLGSLLMTIPIGATSHCSQLSQCLPPLRLLGPRPVASARCQQPTLMSVCSLR